MTQELCDKVCEKPFKLKYCPDRYKNQKMCDNAVNTYLLALKFVPDWFATSKMIEKLNTAVFYNVYIVFGDLESDLLHYLAVNRPYSVILDKINLDDNSFDNCDRETINHVKLMAFHNKYKQLKASKKR